MNECGSNGRGQDRIAAKEIDLDVLRIAESVVYVGVARALHMSGIGTHDLPSARAALKGGWLDNSETPSGASNSANQDYQLL